MNHQTEQGAPYPRETAKQCIGEGWAPLIDRIYDYADELGVQMTILQVKEKFGTLRVYGYNIDDEIQSILDRYAALSADTCMTCGKAGTMREKNRWLYVACDQHKDR